MFEEDQPTTQGGNVPGNLPVGEPEDIFGATEAADAPAPLAAPAAGEAAEAPAEAARPATALEAGALRPKTETAAPAGMFEEPLTMPPEEPVREAGPIGPDVPPPAGAASASPAEISPMKGPSVSRGIMTAIIGGVVLLIVLGGGWWIYASFVRGGGEKLFEAVPPAAPAVEEPAPAGVVSPAAPEVTREAVEATILFGEPIDADADQLDDDLERTIGTDPNNWDTDGDELSDGDEKLVWETDPLNPDTDGDSYPDGQEVRSGYSPTGQGRLFEPPTTTP